MTELGKKATSDRMVRDYVTRLYVPAAAHDAALRADGFAEAKALAAFVTRVQGRRGPRCTSTTSTRSGIPQQAQAGDTPRGARRRAARRALARRRRRRARLRPHRTRTTRSRAITPCTASRPSGEAVDGVTTFTGVLPLTVTGTFGYTVRVVPTHPQLVSPVELGLVTYAS